MDVTGVSSNSRWQLEGARIGRGGGELARWCWRIGRGGGEIVAGAGKTEMFSLFSSLPPPEHHLLCNNKLKLYSEFTR